MESTMASAASKKAAAHGRVPLDPTTSKTSVKSGATNATKTMMETGKSPAARKGAPCDFRSEELTRAKSNNDFLLDSEARVLI